MTVQKVSVTETNRERLGFTKQIFSDIAVESLCRKSPSFALFSPGTDDYYVFSFFDDVLMVPDVTEALSRLQQNAQTCIMSVHRHKEVWRRFRALWSMDKAKVCQQFLERNPTLARFDEKLAYYAATIAELRRRDDFVFIGCIRVNQRPLMEDICEHAHAWKDMLGG